ncbi:hypothetical protein BROUX41_005853 [Berkeleyomyces rouxiae]|uniref:uncharacterized protein n=1 Tax=Berkeleyomyces rouxiae TaxID=2035830 RepID=UPI003B7A22CF
MSTTTEKLFAVGNNLNGLERLFRGVQALLHIATTAPVVLPLLSALVSGRPEAAAPAHVLAAMLRAKATINVTRRFMRLFAFSEAFGSARAAVRPAGAAGRSPSRRSSSSSGATPSAASAAAAVAAAASAAAPGSPEALLDALRGSFFGIHGLLESLTALDLAGVAVWPAARAAQMDREALRMWVVALACSALATGVRMLGLRAYEAVNAVDSFGDMGVGEGMEGAEKGKGEGEKKEGEQRDEPALALAQRRKAAAREATAARRAAMRRLQRRFVADALDMLVPASDLMWVEVSEPVIGVVMLVTTVLGFVDTWGTY